MPEMSYDLYESTFQVNALVYEPYIAIVMVRHELNADTSSLVGTIVVTYAKRGLSFQYKA